VRDNVFLGNKIFGIVLYEYARVCSFAIVHG